MTDDRALARETLAEILRLLGETDHVPEIIDGMAPVIAAALTRARQDDLGRRESAVDAGREHETAHDGTD